MAKKGKSKETKPHVKRIPFSATSMTPTVTPIGSNIPAVIYAREAWEKMWKIVEICEAEVGWLGLVDEIDGGYLVTDIFLLEQEVTGATTDIESDAVANLAVELESQGIDSSKLRYWGHSHVNMQVGPSGQDENQTEEYLQAGCEYFIRGIYNKRREQKVDVFDMRKSLVYQKVSSQVYDPAFTGQWLENLKDEIKLKVKKKVYTYPGYGAYNKNHKGLRNNNPVVTTADLNDKFQEQRDFDWGYGDWKSWQF